MPRYIVLRFFACAAVLLGSTLGVVVPSSTQAAAEQVATVQTERALRPDCGPKRYAKPGGGYWRCSFADNFDGTRLNRNKWHVVTTEDNGYLSGTDACFVDDPANVFVSNGSLKLRTVTKLLHLCNHPGALGFLTNYTSGSVTTGDFFKQTYGRYEFRVKFPESKRSGLHSAVWLYPNRATYGAWPASGEIDIAERFTSYTNRLIPYIHYLRNGEEHHDTNEECRVADLSERFHKIVLIWTVRGMTVKYNGDVCLKTRTRSDLAANKPFDMPFSVLLTQALGIGWNPFTPGWTPVPATMTIDYVRVWR
ncbi:MAG TPA: glycoside hydrolase family 16 protein [Nocardioidaceae bacterium]|nr:glycoside hydrolase family 16 protein [Nocardioidaceae bacterium]